MEGSLLRSIAKLAMFGEMAGFTLDEMIDLLNGGLTVEGLLALIEWRLAFGEGTAMAVSPSPPGLH
jgi:hypothetical protein